ncbi:MAG: PEP/pyruvate-binding domain-containing protein, partial [Methanomassiliicoccales archaeon]
AMAYRNDNGFGQGGGIAVLVQKMVDARCAGIMFTKDPVTGSDKVIVESSWGLGESIASGIVTPDRFVLSKGGRVEHRAINRKSKGVFLVGGTEVTRDVEGEKQTVASLTDREAEELAHLGRKMEEHFGRPQDIEWAIEGKDIHVLQSRPITTLSKDETLWTRAYGDEYWADVTSPLFFSVLGEYLTKIVNHEGSAIMGYKELTDKVLLRLHKGHIYFNSEVLESVFTYNPKFSRTKELLNYFPEKDQKRIADAPTKIFKRLWAEVRIGFLDPDGMIFRTNKAYLRWADAYLKAMQPYDALDLTTLKDAELEGQYRYMEKNYLKHYRLIRYGMVTHSIGTNLMVKRWLSDWLDDRSGVLYSKVISGLKGNKTIETNIALAKLANIARADPEVMLQLNSLSSAEFYHHCFADPQLAQFNAATQAFMKNYGQRSHTRELYFPRWADDPALVVDIVRSLAASNEVDLEAKERQKAGERAAAEEDIGQRIGKLRYGFFKKRIFFLVLGYAQTYLIFRENQRFYLDHILYRQRRLFMEYGRRWTAAGYLDVPEDIFFLSKEEIFEMGATGAKDVRRTVEGRRKEFEKWKDRLPAKFLKGKIEFDDTVERMEGVLRITGTSASPGVVSGIVRVVDNITHLGEVKDGEILVTSNTDPGWTAVFSKIGGLITETGGILSHGAVVSREYGIPAVTAVKGATRIFKSGQRITLDGNQGLIYISEG